MVGPAGGFDPAPDPHGGVFLRNADQLQPDADRLQGGDAQFGGWQVAGRVIVECRAHLRRALGDNVRQQAEQQIVGLVDIARRLLER